MSQETVSRTPPALAADESATAYAVTLMEHLVVPTFVLDAQQRVVVWNKACERLTGVGAAEVIGTRNHWTAFYEAPRPCLADLVASGDWEMIGKLYTMHEDPGTPTFGVHAENWCVMPRRGRKLYLAVDAGPVYDDAGHLIAIVETLRDITEKKLAQAKVQEQASILQAQYEEHRREAELARRILDHQIRADLMKQSGVRHAVTPATHFSGDMVLAARSPGGQLYSILADATGHGLAAAVSVLPIVQEFYRLVELSQPLIAIVESINFLLANSLPLGRFVAAAFVCVDQEKRQGEVWVGGVPDVLMLEESGRILRRFASRHLPLGVSKEIRDVGAAEIFAWETPCRLLMLSDGVVEAMDAKGEPFGETRLFGCLTAAPGDPLIESLQTELRKHLQGHPAHDDMSILVIDCPAGREEALMAPTP